MSLSDNPSVPNPRHLLKRYSVKLFTANWSENTVDRRRCSLGRFVEWLEQREVRCVTKLDSSLLEAYRRALYYHRDYHLNAKTNEPLNFSIQSSYLSARKKWITRLYDQGWSPADYGQALSLPKGECRLPASDLNFSEIDTVLNTVNVMAPLGLRDRSMLEILYSTGMRRSELGKLRLDDVDCERRLIVLRLRKNRKDPVVPIGVSAMK